MQKMLVLLESSNKSSFSILELKYCLICFSLRYIRIFYKYIFYYEFKTLKPIYFYGYCIYVSYYKFSTLKKFVRILMISFLLFFKNLTLYLINLYIYKFGT